MAGSVTLEVVTVDKRGRGIVDVIDGSPPLGIERSADVAARHRLLRTIGYKL